MKNTSGAANAKQIAAARIASTITTLNAIRAALNNIVSKTQQGEPFVPF